MVADAVDDCATRVLKSQANYPIVLFAIEKREAEINHNVFLGEISRFGVLASGCRCRRTT